MVPPSRPFNRYAIAAVVCGLLWPIGVVALALGHKARSTIEESGGTQRGAALARAAIVIGWIQVAFWAAIAVYIVVVLAYVVLSGQPIFY